MKRAKAVFAVCLTSRCIVVAVAEEERDLRASLHCHCHLGFYLLPSPHRLQLLHRPEEQEEQKQEEAVSGAVGDREHDLVLEREGLLRVFLREEVAEVVVGHRLLLEEEVLVAVGFAVRSWRPRHSCYKHAAERRDVLGGRASG
jgi:hypothetical protein